MPRKRTIGTVIILAALVAPCAAGAKLKRRVTKAVISHEEGTVEVQSSTVPLESPIELTLREDESLEIVVRDPNPLVFTYKGIDVAAVESPDYKVAREFAGVVQKLIGQLPKSSESGGKAALGAKEAGCVTLPASLSEPESRRCLVTLVTPALQRLRAHASEMPDLVQRSAAPGGAPGVKKTVAAWEDGPDANLVRKALALASDRRIDRLTAKPPGGSPSAQETYDEDYVERLAAAAGDIQKTLDSLKQFTDRAVQIDEPMPLGMVTYSALQITGRDVEIAAAPDQEKPAKDSRRKLGTFRFTATPYSPVHLALGPALLYSFVQQPSYAAKTAADGHLHLVRTDSGGDVTGTQVGAMLSIEPRAWSDPTFGGSFQVGVSPSAGKLGLFFGAALRLFHITSLGAGLALQQRDELDEGLVEGQALAAEGDLKTHKRFRPGLYFSATVTLP